jgi:hypothetical protein
MVRSATVDSRPCESKHLRAEAGRLKPRARRVEKRLLHRAQGAERRRALEQLDLVRAPLVREARLEAAQRLAQFARLGLGALLGKLKGADSLARLQLK